MSSDPRDVAVAHVLKDGTPAGTLRRVDGGVEFSYRDDYLTGDLRAVATTLPLTDEPVRTVGGAVPAFFANLLALQRRTSDPSLGSRTRSDRRSAAS